MRSSRRVRSTFPWYADVALLVGGYLAFALVRAAIDRGDPAATDHALGVQSLERKLGIAVEYSLNHTMLGHPVAIYLTGYFYRLCLLAVPVVLIWLRVRRPASYGRLRTVLVITTVLDLPLVLLFPESPPRFAQDGIVDYIARHDIVGGASLATPHSGVNLARRDAEHACRLDHLVRLRDLVGLGFTRSTGCLVGLAVPRLHRLRRACHRTSLRPGYRRRGGPGCHRGPVDLPGRWPGPPGRTFAAGSTSDHH